VEYRVNLENRKDRKPDSGTATFSSAAKQRRKLAQGEALRALGNAPHKIRAASRRQRVQLSVPLSESRTVRLAGMSPLRGCDSYSNVTQGSQSLALG